MVAELRPHKLSAKHKLGQHRSKRQIESVLQGLWQRGAAGDLPALRLIKGSAPRAAGVPTRTRPERVVRGT